MDRIGKIVLIAIIALPRRFDISRSRSVGVCQMDARFRFFKKAKKGKKEGLNDVQDEPHYLRTPRNLNAAKGFNLMGQKSREDKANIRASQWRTKIHRTYTTPVDLAMINTRSTSPCVAEGVQTCRYMTYHKRCNSGTTTAKIVTTRVQNMRLRNSKCSVNSGTLCKGVSFWIYQAKGFDFGRIVPLHPQIILVSPSSNSR